MIIRDILDDDIEVAIKVGSWQFFKKMLSSILKLKYERTLNSSFIDFFRLV